MPLFYTDIKEHLDFNNFSVSIWKIVKYEGKNPSEILGLSLGGFEKLMRTILGIFKLN